MDRHLANIFFAEIISKCDLAEKCINRLNRYLHTERAQVPLIFESIYSYLNFASNVSLILWPSTRGKAIMRQPRSKRSVYLRAALSISNESLLRDRKFRDHLVHMDERLDAWWVESQNHNIARYVIGGRNTIGGLHQSDIFEHYVPEERVFIFRGEEFNLQDVHSELMTIKAKAEFQLN